jgi:hypothetical protein
VALGREGRLDSALAEHIVEFVVGEGAEMGFGIEARNEVGPDADPMARLLDLSGRAEPRPS